MGQTLQRCLGTVVDLTESQYTTETATGRAALCCPRCGEVSELPETHAVMQGGGIAPIWQCVECGYREFVVLESWDV